MNTSFRKLPFIKIHKTVLSLKRISLCQVNYLVTRKCSTPAHSIENIKQWLHSFPGGNVKLDKSNSDINIIQWEHPNRKNAFTGFMMTQLYDILVELEKDSPKGVIFCGACDNFCSGTDLNFAEQTANHRDGMRISSFMQNIANMITRLPAVSVALIDGYALGTGSELAMCADFRVATPNSIIAFKQIEMGFTPGWGGGARLVSIIGRENALRFLLSGESLHPNQALAMDLYDHLLPGTPLADSGGRLKVNSPVEDTVAWLAKIIGKAPKSLVHAVKQVVHGTAFPAVRGGLAEEKSVFGTSWAGEEHLKAIEANTHHAFVVKP